MAPPLPGYLDMQTACAHQQFRCRDWTQSVQQVFLAGLQTWKKNRKMMLCTPCSKELWCLMRQSSGKLLSRLMSQFDLPWEIPTQFSANKYILQYISGYMGTEDSCKPFCAHHTPHTLLCSRPEPVAALYPQHCVLTGRVSTGRVSTKKEQCSSHNKL